MEDTYFPLILVRILVSFVCIFLIMFSLGYGRRPLCRFSLLLWIAFFSLSRPRVQKGVLLFFSSDFSTALSVAVSMSLANLFKLQFLFSCWSLRLFSNLFQFIFFKLYFSHPVSFSSSPSAIFVAIRKWMAFHTLIVSSSNTVQSLSLVVNSPLPLLCLYLSPL